MTKTIRLVTGEIESLYFPSGGINGADFKPAENKPSLLIRVYPAGDCDTIPFPFPAGREAEMRKRLAYALYDERETNPFFPTDAVIELPDGTVFNFDDLVR